MTDHEALQGFWKLTSSTLNGQPFKHPDIGTIFQFTGNRFRHIRSRVSYRFELHPELDPKGIDFVQVSTRSVARGIYDLDGDQLRIRGNTWGKPRGVSFDDVDHPLEIYMRYKRRVAIKRRVRAQIPQSVFEEGYLPKEYLETLLKKK